MTLAQAHQMDALVLIPNCDKIVPGMLMAAARLNIPSILVSGGPMLAGHFGGEEISLSKTFETVGAYKAGLVTEEQLMECECGSCPGLRFLLGYVHCKLDELPVRGHRYGSAGQRHHSGCPWQHVSIWQSMPGMKIMELLEKDIKPRDILTPKAFRNALTCEMALGCSTNTVLHLLAIAHEAGVDVNLELLNELSSKVPNLCHLAPAGPHHIEELYMAGGIRLLCTS